MESAIRSRWQGVKYVGIEFDDSERKTTQLRIYEGGAWGDYEGRISVRKVLARSAG